MDLLAGHQMRSANPAWAPTSRRSAKIESAKDPGQYPGVTASGATAGSAGSERMVITSAGNVGVGTTMPAHIAVEWSSVVCCSPDLVGRG